jgi:protein-ribulosamine 3-kinase
MFEILQNIDEPPSLLHGDLWSGNYLVDSSGAPVLIDPATYYGHRETDLAMMKLFGGFPDELFRRVQLFVSAA